MNNKQFKQNEIVNFEKWVSRSLGPEMVTTIKQNGYINSGNVKPVIESIFKNAYSKDFVRLVKLNNHLAKNKYLTSKDNQLTSLKVENLKLSEQINKVKSSIVKMQNETAKLVESFNDVKQKRLTSDSSENLNKQLKIMLMKNLIKSSKDFRLKLENAIEQFSNFISADDECDLKKEDYEHLIHSFCMTHKNQKSSLKTHLTPQKKASSENANSKCTKKYSKLSIKDLIVKYMNSKLNDELAKIDQIIDQKTISNEVNLIAYQLGIEDNLSFSQNLEDLFIDLLNKESFEINRREFECIKFKKEKAKIDREFAQMGVVLNNLICKNYTNLSDSKLIGEFFQTFFALKHLTIGISETEKLLEAISKQTQLESNTQKLKGKLDKIRELENIINEKQLEIEQLHEQNRQFFKTKYPTCLNILKSAIETCVDEVREFNVRFQFGQPNSINKSDLSLFQSSIVSTSQWTSTWLAGDHRPYHNKLGGGGGGFLSSTFSSKLKLPPSLMRNQCELLPIRAATISTNEHAKLTKLEDFLKFNRFGSRYFLLPKLIDYFIQLNLKIKSIETAADEQMTNHEDAREMVDELNQLVLKSNQADKAIVDKYVNQMVKQIKECENQTKMIDQMEKLLYIWLEQPAANVCFLENYTVNGKHLKYYLDFIDQVIVEKARSNRFVK